MFNKIGIVLSVFFLSSIAYAQNNTVKIVGYIEGGSKAKVYAGDTYLCGGRGGGYPYWETRTIVCNEEFLGQSVVLTLRTESSDGDTWQGCDSWSDDGGNSEQCTIYLKNAPREVYFYTTGDLPED